MNFYLITGLYLTIGGLGVGIFLWGKPDGNSLFDRLYRLVCRQCPWALKKALEKCCGPRAPAALDAAWNYVCFKSNPIVQVFYLLVVVGGYLVFVAYGYPHIPSNDLSAVHKYVGFGMFASCLFVWWRACTVDPGTLTPANVEDLCEFYQWDNTIFVSAQCGTCQLLKPARSKHCSMCNICVAKFDHHCIWINNCVGVGNHKWFLGFLFTHLSICLYGSGLGTTIAYGIIVEKDLFKAVFIDPVSKERHPATYTIIAQYMLATEGMVIFVTILCLVMGLVLCGFFLWHLNLVRVGTTTNEHSKWSYVKWCLKQEGDSGNERLKELRNIYNQGIVANYREVFWPIDVHRMPGKPAAEAGQNGGAPKGGGGGGKKEEPGAPRQRKGQKAKKG
mmetsp:Transcript_73470/g.192680  ORF Transcript_73470/g.192680 Transcript_73470/m.192680 type:complete len:390 (-) Transcript_73470:47-1216(-)